MTKSNLKDNIFEFESNVPDVRTSERADISVSGLRNNRRKLKLFSSTEKEKFVAISESTSKIYDYIDDTIHNYIKIGCELQKIFKDKSYQSISSPKTEKRYFYEDDYYQFVQEYFGFSKTTAYNLRRVAFLFSNKDGVINSKYKDYSFSQLTEMSSISSFDIELVKPYHSIEQIRNFKRIRKSNNFGGSTYTLEDYLRIDNEKKLQSNVRTSEPANDVLEGQTYVIDNGEIVYETVHVPEDVHNQHLQNNSSIVNEVLKIVECYKEFNIDNSFLDDFIRISISGLPHKLTINRKDTSDGLCYCLIREVLLQMKNVRDILILNK